VADARRGSGGPGPDTPAAHQVADLVAKAAEVLSAPNASREVLDEFASTLRATLGIHAVRRESTPRQVLVASAARGGPARAEHWLAAATTQPDPAPFVVELACPEDAEWVSPDQSRLLDSALAVIESAMTEAGAEHVARLSEGLLRHARSVVVELRHDGWVVHSDAITRVLGYPRDHPVGERPLAMVDPRDRYTALRAYVETQLDRYSHRTVALRVRAADGTLRVLETTFVDLAPAAGRHAVVLYGLDVTEQRAERARMRELVMRLPGAVLVVDETGRVRLANDTFTRTFGTRAGGWIGTSNQEVLRSVADVCLDEHPTWRILLELTTEERRRTVRLVLVDGRVLDLDRVPLVERDVDLGSVWQFRDVTVEAAASTGATAAPDTDHVARLDDQNRVLATISHELRTPLTAVLSFVELLADPETGRLNDGQRIATEVIRRNTRRLLTLVDDLLLLSRLERGQLPLRTCRVEVHRLVTDAVDDRRIEAADMGIRLTCRTDPGPDAVGDASRLQQVLDNVVHNALKFSATGSTVRVAAVHDGEHWTVTVADSGMGIPPADLDLVTRGFQRGANAVAAGIPGSGLGLAVCREVVELHHGSLEIESVLDVGTTVRITLPDGEGP